MEFFVDFFLLFVVENLGGNTIFDILEPLFLKNIANIGCLKTLSLSLSLSLNSLFF